MELIVIGLIALVAAALLSPLEALGWWAGWYGDRVDTHAASKPAINSIPARSASRYIVYLDGISQFQTTYSPEVEAFLKALGEALPSMAIVRGIMPYSVLQKSLVKGRPFAVFWRAIAWLRAKRFFRVLGILVNIRNLLIVAVSADQRYGPVYDRGMAQLIHDHLIEQGYPPQSQVPITLLGFSGGGEIACGAAPLLKQALNAPIEIISLGGVFGGHNNVLPVEHVYHLVGDRDPVERIGAVMFPKRWRLLFLSYWNRAKRRGQVSLISLGPVGHQSPGGVLDRQQQLPDGRTYSQQTIDWVTGILRGTLPPVQFNDAPPLSSYRLYQKSPSNQPATYPIAPAAPSEYYRPIAPWMGRLILPTPAERQPSDGVWFEVYHATADYTHLVGQVVWLSWQHSPRVQDYIRIVTHDLYFSPDAEYSLRQGKIVPQRLNGWRAVGPLESLAGARPHDNMVVMLNGSIRAETSSEATTHVLIDQDPAQITGRFYTIAQFGSPLQANADGVQYEVRHFNPQSGQFDGPTETVFLPEVVPNQNGLRLSSTEHLERSPCNDAGWYLYGAQDAAGQFVVQAIAPYALFQLEPDHTIVGISAGRRYLKQSSWAVTGQKGTLSSTLLQANETPTSPLQEGDRLLLNHVYGGIGGEMREPAAQGPVYFGHFAYGLATVVREPLTDELRLAIQYFQVYTHNGDGLIAGRHHWSSYMGDRQYGWLGVRPVRDIAIKMPALTNRYPITGAKTHRSALDELLHQLQIMMARYRIGDGTGATYVGPANNCAQDSNQALYGTLQKMARVWSRQSAMHNWLEAHPQAAAQFEPLIQLTRSLRRNLIPWGTARADWTTHEADLGSSLEDDPLQQLMRGLLSWRTMFPRIASDTVTVAFLKQNATVLVLRTNQIGGIEPAIEPIAPMGF